MRSTDCLPPAFPLALVLGLVAGAGLDAAEEAALPAKAQEVLKAHCYRCHGKDGAARGGMNFILDRDKLLARQKILPGSAAESKLYQRVLHGEMPPEGIKLRPGKEEVALLKQWIDAGAAPALPP